MRLHILNCSWSPQGLMAEADAQQDFIDMLAKDVIKPLEKLKVSQEDLASEGIFVLMGALEGSEQ